VVVKRVGESAWILRPTEALVQGVVDDLRDVFLESVDAGAQDVVVDLSGVEVVAPSGAETIVAMADLMRGRHATLWLAARGSDGNGHALRAIDEEGRSALIGLSAALDAALAQLPVEDGPRRETIFGNLHTPLISAPSIRKPRSDAPRSVSPT
jgi:hypothetical protein